MRAHTLAAPAACGKASVGPAGMPSLPERLWTTKDAATFLRLHPKTVLGYIRRGILPYHSRVGGRYRFDPVEIARWRKEGCST